MHLRPLLPLAAALVLAALVPAAPAPAATQSYPNCAPDASECFFPKTGFKASGRIYEYWKQNGGLPIFGYPIKSQAKEMVEGTQYQVQWFERNRLELHPENARPFDVLLGRLGVDRLVQQGRDWQDISQPEFVRDPATPAQPNCSYFGTQFWSCPLLLTYWSSNGLNLGDPGVSNRESLALFGLPVSNRHSEDLPFGNSIEPFDVQWFERARFEYHPENPPDQRVQLGLLGSEILAGGPTPISLALLSLPTSAADELAASAQANDLSAARIARDAASLFAGDGNGLVLTPLADSSGIDGAALIAAPQRFSTTPLGGLTIFQGSAPGTYLVVLSADGSRLRFVGRDQSFELPVVIRELPQAPPQPLALVNADQVCLTVDTAQVCGQFGDPFNRQFAAQLRESAAKLNVEVRPDRTVALVAGERALAACASGLDQPDPDYAACRASVLAAPAPGDDAFPEPDVPGYRALSLGVVQALDDLREHVYSDPALTKEVGSLPLGDYLAYDLQSRDRQQDGDLGRGVRLGRVLLRGTNGDFFIPAVSGATLLGDKIAAGQALGGSADAAAGASLILRNRCFFNSSSCPFVQ